MNSVYTLCRCAYESKWADALLQIPTSLYKICCLIISILKKYIVYKKGDHTFVTSLKMDISLTRKHIADLTFRIRTLDVFIESHPEIRKAVAEHLLKYGQYTANARVVYAPNSDDDVVQAWSRLKHYEIDLELLWDKRILFIEAHKKVKACIAKYILKDMQHQNCAIDDRKVLSLLPFFTDKESDVSLSHR